MDHSQSQTSPPDSFTKGEPGPKDSDANKEKVEPAEDLHVGEQHHGSLGSEVPEKSTEEHTRKDLAA